MKTKSQVLILAVFLGLSASANAAAPSCGGLFENLELSERLTVESMKHLSGNKFVNGWVTSKNAPDQKIVEQVTQTFPEGKDLDIFVEDYKNMMALIGSSNASSSHVLSILLAAKKSNTDPIEMYQNQADISRYFRDHQTGKIHSRSVVNPTPEQVLQIMGYSKRFLLSAKETLEQMTLAGNVLDSNPQIFNTTFSTDNYRKALEVMTVHKKYPSIGKNLEEATSTMVRYMSFKPVVKLENLVLWGKGRLPIKEYQVTYFLSFMGAAKARILHLQGKPMTEIQQTLMLENKEVNFLSGRRMGDQ